MRCLAACALAVGAVNAQAAFAGVRSLERGEWLIGAGPAADSGREVLLVPTNARDLGATLVYLAELQQRFADTIDVVAVVPHSIPADGLAAARAAIGDARIAVTLQPELHRAVSGAVSLLAADGEPLWTGDVSSGLVGLLRRWQQDEDRGVLRALAGDERLRLEELGELEDHDTASLRAAARQALARNDGNPDAWLLELIVAVERMGDLERARHVADRALRQLALDGKAVIRFVDKLLRTVPDDAVILQSCLMALVPVAPALAGDFDAQLVYLAALSGVGRVREARILVERLVGMAPRWPSGHVRLAEALTFGSLAPEFAATARAQLELAAQRDPGPDHLLVEYRVRRHCERDMAAADAVLDRFVQTLGGLPALNNTVWFMVTQEPRRGRFRAAAAALAQRMLESRQIDGAELDTIALAFFLDGRVEDAVELQIRAVELTSQTTYRARLQRYQQVLERQRR